VVARAALKTLAASFLTPDVNISAIESGLFDCPVSDERIEQWLGELSLYQLKVLMALQWNFNSSLSAPFTRAFPQFVFNYIGPKNKRGICMRTLLSFKI
jgi:hypothetical protein